MEHLKIQNLSFSRGHHKVLDDVSFNVSQGELLSILGASGSGKTTLLRICAGFEVPSSGEVSWGGYGQLSEVLPSHQDIGFVFQDFALFEHLSAKENIEYGCTDAVSFGRAQELISQLKIQDLLGRRPCDISGGERQRVALARALTLEPKLLYMDEPFSSIDRHQTQTLIDEFRDLFLRLQVTVVMVTHSLDEALQFSDRILFLSEGKIAQDGAVEDFFMNPASPTVAAFFGGALWLDGDCDGKTFKTEAGTVPLRTKAASGKAKMMVRMPERPFIYPVLK